MSSWSWFRRLAVFVIVLVILDRFFGWNVSIVGSVLVTLVVHFILEALESP